ncbi:MAG TPA: glycosyltransferase family 2 protein [Patescibacteria group bacterium]
MPLSVVINTKNSASTLGLTLKSIKNLADEIVIVDMMSTDNTKELAEAHTDKVFSHPDVGYVEPARNYAIQKASHDWILIVDADEEVPPALQEMITHITSGNAEADCYYLPRKNMIFNKWIAHTGWWPDYVLRLFKKGYVNWDNEIHSIPITKGVVVELPAQEELALIHHNYQNVSQYLARLNRYTTIQAAEAKEEPVFKRSLFATWSNQFLARFFAQEGHKDGQHGLALALLQAFYEVAVELKIWENDNFNQNSTSSTQAIRDLRQFQRDVNYWIADYQIHRTSGLNNLWWRLRRKFKI